MSELGLALQIVLPASAVALAILMMPTIWDWNW
jgi:hypothetical protein